MHLFAVLLVAPSRLHTGPAGVPATTLCHRWTLSIVTHYFSSFSGLSIITLYGADVYTSNRYQY